jgi:hypothetical protein
VSKHGLLMENDGSKTADAMVIGLTSGCALLWLYASPGLITARQMDR